MALYSSSSGTGTLHAVALTAVVLWLSCFCLGLFLQLHGGSAQDFGSSRPNWASYGWAAFAIPAAPAGSPLTKARVEVRKSQQLLVAAELAGMANAVT